MSDNGESEYNLIEDSEKDNLNEETKDIVKDFNEISNYYSPSLINKINSSTDNNSTVKKLINEIKDNIFPFPYLNKKKISEIKIKNENYLTSGEEIQAYIKSPINKKFIDNIYNICDRCNKNINCTFCNNCYKNFCEKCSNNCKKRMHELIELQKLKDEIEYYKKDIKRIIKEYFIEPEKKETNGEKEQKTYILFDEYEIIDDKFTKKIKIYTNDILLIESIIEKNYNNYLHYKNIKNCYRYLQKKYDINNQITIEYKVEKGDTKIRIFGGNFVKHNREKCFIICENNEFELSEYFEFKNFIDDNILKIKLIGINNITNMESMFC